LEATRPQLLQERAALRSDAMSGRRRSISPRRWSVRAATGGAGGILGFLTPSRSLLSHGSIFFLGDGLDLSALVLCWCIRGFSFDF
jgi:hypothetical protein